VSLGCSETVARRQFGLKEANDDRICRTRRLLGTRLRLRRPGVVDGICVGIGLGVLLGDFVVWLLIGIGAGFAAMALIAALRK